MEKNCAKTNICTTSGCNLNFIKKHGLCQNLALLFATRGPKNNHEIELLYSYQGGIPTEFHEVFFRILSTIPPPLPPYSLILLLSDKILL